SFKAPPRAITFLSPSAPLQVAPSLYGVRVLQISSSLLPPMPPQPISELPPTAACLPFSQKAQPRYALPILASLPFLLRLNSSKSRGAPSCPVSLCILQ